MNTKLTLTIEEEIILRAKKYAKQNGRSLSAIIENYLKIITKEETKVKKEITPLVKSLKGSFKAPKNYNYKKELSEGLSEKIFIKMENILIDTDVILDFFFDRKPFSDNAAIVLSYCESNKLKGFITPVICSNIYYVLRRTSKHEKVIERLSQLLTFIDVLQMDKEIVLESLNSKFKDFEDALQSFSAARSGIIDAIITRNIKDFTNSKIGVITPDNFLKTINASR